MLLNNKLKIPENTKAILWDMDGVLIDSLGLDFKICNTLLRKYFGKRVSVSSEFIKASFGYSIPEFWQRALKEIGIDLQEAENEEKYQKLVDEYGELRLNSTFELNPGVEELMRVARYRGLKQAVVSNNRTVEVLKILNNVGIEEYFDEVLGNDLQDGDKVLAKKPAPDFYILAARKMALENKDCVVIEDSELGIQAGNKAGSYTIGVSTGSLTWEELEQLKKLEQVSAIYKTLK